MSDIRINLDGLLSLAVVALLAFCLFFAILICFLVAWSRSSRTGGIKNDRLFPHILGMAFSLIAVFLAPLLVWVVTGMVTPSGTEPEPLLDRWVLVWGGAALLPWPLTVFQGRRRTR